MVSKSEIIYGLLREDIINGKFLPKQRLIERELTNVYKVSKTPIREALARLRQDGLIEGTFNQGMYVSHMSPQDALEIYEIREYLEGLVAKKATESVTSELIHKIDEIIELSNEYIKNDIREFFRLNLDFHNIIKSHCGNKRLDVMLELIYSQYRALLTVDWQIPIRGPETVLDEHKKIAEAIKAKNSQLAEEMAREHIRNACKAIASWFRKNG